MTRIRPSRDLVRLVVVWAAWLFVLSAFQIVVAARFQPQRPDRVLAWTQHETGTSVLDCRPLLADPTLNEHVAFDSEYYLSIAIAGYDDPDAQAFAVRPSGTLFQGVPSCSPGVPDHWTSLDYAFLPGYPMAMRATMAIIQPFTSGLSVIGRATLAGIIVSALGALLAMLALARLWASLERRLQRGSAPARPGPDPVDAGRAAQPGPWGGPGGLRVAFYLLIFPTGFYLAQVYTEGLFVGFAFMACAMAIERRILLGALLAALATLVRPSGALLALPLMWSAVQVARDGWASRRWRLAIPAVAAFAPVAAFTGWYASPLGVQWRSVEDGFFHRSFDPAGSWTTVVATWNSLVGGVDVTGTPGSYSYFGGGPLNSSSAVYIGLELAAVALAVIATVWLFRWMPGVALFGLGVLVLSVGSQANAAQGMDRYVLAIPAIYLLLARLGRHAAVDRAWSLASTLVMGLLATLFTFGFWVS